MRYYTSLAHLRQWRIHLRSNQELLLPVAVVPAARSRMSLTVGEACTRVACKAAEFQVR
jgi:hypothetical protein